MEVMREYLQIVSVREDNVKHRERQRKMIHCSDFQRRKRKK